MPFIRVKTYGTIVSTRRKLDELWTSNGYYTSYYPNKYCIDIGKSLVYIV